MLQHWMRSVYGSMESYFNKQQQSRPREQLAATLGPALGSSTGRQLLRYVVVLGQTMQRWQGGAKQQQALQSMAEIVFLQLEEQ
jgi:hypothetical protein